MKFLLAMFRIFVRFFRRLASFCNAKNFAAFGKGSRLGLRSRLVQPHLVSVGENVILGDSVWINACDDRKDGAVTLLIGHGTYVGNFVQINAWRDVVIESNVLVADRVFISDADHRFHRPDIPIKHQGDHFKGSIRISEGCWLGIGSVIMPGVTVGRNAVVAANAVVTRDVPDRSIVAGVPARVIGTIE